MSDLSGLDAPTRSMLLTSLQEFSNTCLPGAMRVECPFYEESASGPACGEQCHDVLAAHGSNAPDTSIPISAGLAATPRGRSRTRRGPGPDARPFDAQELSFLHQDFPTDQKSTTALLMEVNDLLTTAPWSTDDEEDRAYLIRADLAELEKRGIHAEEVVRDGMGDELATLLTLLLVYPYLEPLPNFEMNETMNEAVARTPVEWTAMAQVASVDSGMAALPQLLTRLGEWVDTAPLDDILLWTAPETPPRPLPAPRDRTRGRWVVDRFTRTYLHDWRATSLAREWQYMASVMPRPIPAQAMQERRVAPELLSATIADRAAGEWCDDEPAEPRALDVSTLTRYVITRLHDGDSDAALAICEALARLLPNDADAQNNLGFCLIPSQPHAALPHLERAAELGIGTSINWMNQVLCLHLMEREADAQTLARERLAGDFDGAEQVFGWVMIDGDLTFKGPIDASAYWDMLANAIEGS